VSRRVAALRYVSGMRTIRGGALVAAAALAVPALALAAPPPPVVSITSGPPAKIVVKGGQTATATWEFTTDRAANLTCKFTGYKVQPCHSPRTYANLLPGKYKFTVYSSDPKLDLALTSAKQELKVVKAKKK